MYVLVVGWCRCRRMLSFRDSCSAAIVVCRRDEVTVRWRCDSTIYIEVFVMHVGSMRP